jgi:hypothetical protein
MKKRGESKGSGFIIQVFAIPLHFPSVLIIKPDPLCAPLIIKPDPLCAPLKHPGDTCTNRIPSMRFQFTIRDLLWLTVVAALGICWWLHVRSIEFRHLSHQKQLYREALELRNEVRDELEKMNRR